MRDLLKLSFYNVAYKVKRAAAELLRNIEGTDRRDKDHCYARNNAGHTHRNYATANAGKTVAAKILTGFDHTVVKLCHNGINRCYHKGQEIVNHTEDNRTLRINHMHGVDADFNKKRVYYTSVLQKSHPRIGTDKKAHPHREHNEKHKCALYLFSLLRNKIGKRKSNNQTDYCGNYTEPD